MKNKGLTITLITFLSLLGIGLITVMILVMIGKIDFGFDWGKSKNMKLVDSYEAKVEEINKIDFNLYSTDIEVKESNSDTIKVEYYSNKEKNAKIKQDGNTIVVNEEETGNYCIGICFNNRKIVLYVPSTYAGEYNYITRSGDIKFDVDTPNNNIEIETTSGDISFESANDVNIITTSGDIKGGNANKVKFHTTSGDVKLKGAKDSSNIETTSGDIYVGAVAKIVIKSTSGDIKLDKVTKSMNLKTVSGDVTVGTLAMTENSNVNTTSGDVTITNNESNCYVDFDSTSGDETVSHSDRKSDLTLKVETTSGDLTVY